MLGVSEAVLRGESIGNLRSGLTASTLTATGKTPSSTNVTVDVRLGSSAKVSKVAYPRPP